MTSGDFLGVDISRARAAQATVTLDGLADVVAKLRRLPGIAKVALGYAMKAEMDGVIHLAQEEYVPIDSGALRESGRVRGPVFISSTVLEVWGSFGPVFNERESAYAIPVHEIPEPPAESVGGRSAHHNHGSWKYLEIAFLVRQEGMVDRLQDEFNLLLGRLGIDAP